MALGELQAALRTVRDGRRLGPGTLAWLTRNGYVAGAGEGPCLTARGRALLKARLVDVHDAADDTRDEAVHLPDALDRLANPREREAALVGPSDVAAARRFQDDLQRAGLAQRITQNWSLSSLSFGGKAARQSSVRNEPVAMLDARDRVNRACTVLGPDLSGLLIDVCLFEKSLSAVEKERHWPARSAKLAIALGLRALARHYGLANTPSGEGVRRT